MNAGEVVNLGLQIRNQWGNATNIQVKIEPMASGAVIPDPYVTMLASTVNYGSAGAFSNSDNLIRENGIVTGLVTLFSFQPCQRLLMVMSFPLKLRSLPKMDWMLPMHRSIHRPPIFMSPS